MLSASHIRNSLILIVLISTFSAAQKMDFPVELNRKISVNFTNTEFSDVLKEISRLAEISINYSKNNIPYAQKITLTESNIAVVSLLKKLCKLTGTQILTGENGEIIITKKSESSIKGKVHDKNNRFPLIGVNIIIKDTYQGAATGINGEFVIDNLNEGLYTLICKYIGYEDKTIRDIKLKAGEPRYLEIEMIEKSISLGEVVVTPGSFGIMQKKPSALQALSKKDIQNMSFGEDIYRAVTRIPGISSGDFSSRFTIRGGETDEILVTLDGMTLYEPFHLKDIHGGVLSIVDAAVIGKANILAGAFPAEYGDKMSGIFEIKSLDPAETKNSISASISMMNARLMGQGSYAGEKGSWIVSARRGYLDFILDKIKDESSLSPAYYDFYAKTDYKLTLSDKITLSFLYGGDDFDFDDEYDSTRADYYNASAWITYDKIWSDKINSQTVLYFNRYDHTRKGIGRNDDTAELEFKINDERNFNLFGIKHNTHYDFSDNLLFKFGFDFSGSSAEYRYSGRFRQSAELLQNPEYKEWENRIVSLYPDGNRFAAYLSGRFKILHNLVAEIGGRYARTTYSDDNLFSPRVNMAWMINPQTTCRAGFGYFYQTQNISGLRVEHGEEQFNKAELAKHYMLGVEHIFDNGLFFRAEAYHKNLTNLKTAYRNISDYIVMFPEVHYDILSIEPEYANSSGLEFLLKYDKGGLFSFWGSYALAISDEKIRDARNLSDESVFRNIKIPRPFDQRNTITFDLNLRPGNNWHINIAWQFRNGWPSTEQFLGEEISDEGYNTYYKFYGDYQQSWLPDYHRLDLKISKYFSSSFGRFNLFLEIMNLYNRDNVRAYYYSIKKNENGVYLQKKEEEWLPFIPSLGIRWDMDF